MSDPIAIIGIGCRFPGNASDPQKFWKLLCEGTDAIGEVPEERWDSRRFFDPDVNAIGKMYVKQGGFLNEKWEDFDAEFFHISPREAIHLDPQQRLVMELAWEAFEDGGIIPATLRNSDTGVFVGAFTTDWQTLHNSPYNRRHCGVYSGINGSKTILSARLSYFFDLKGPCLSVDTACSSSLVAIHLACQSLWRSECSLALAGGVNAMLIPETTIAMAKGRFLNPEGRCRSFDANAKGYIRGEGGGVVILKSLADALRDNDPIYALIRGTGINHDGYTQGIAQPNPEAQKNLIQKVLSESKVEPWQVHYVEAHGTGTPVGDPIEAMALDQAFHHPAKRSHPCYMGSVKSNFGHLEAAAGIAGLIKAALCLKNKRIPPNLHFNKGNPAIPFEEYCLKVPTKLEEFPLLNKTNFAGVNSFGYGGTNAHAVLQSYEGNVELLQELPLNHPLIFPFSAKKSDAFKDVAKNYEEYLDEAPQANLIDIAHSLANNRSQFEHRLSVAAQTRQELKEKLRRIKKGELPEGCIQGSVLSDKPRLVFVYTGMGAQWWGMGRQLMECSPVFLEALKKCDALLVSIAGWSLLDELANHEAHSPMDDPVKAQTANYAIQVALTALMKQWGISPDAVVGHSNGEVAAVYASGALSLEEGLLVTYHRSRIQSKRKNLGTLLAAGLSSKEAQPILEEYQGRICIAAENGPHSITLAGGNEDLQTVADALEKQNIFNRFLKTTIAYHSHHMDGLEEDILDALKELDPKKTLIPLFSTVYADESAERVFDARYWWRNIRQPVLFAQTLQNIITKGFSLFVEIGPHPVLASYIKDGLEQCQVKGGTLASLNRKKNEMMSLMECLGGLYVHGYPLSWSALGLSQGRFISLPTYPWQKKKHWIESEESQQYRLSARHSVMLSRRIISPHPTWQVEVNNQYFPWLEDHKIEGTIVFPAAAYIEAGLALHSLVNGVDSCVLEEVEFKQLFTLQNDKEPLMQVALDERSKRFNVYSLSDPDEGEWMCHASGKCADYAAYFPASKSNQVEFERLQKGPFVDGLELYHQFKEQGLEYGPAFRGIKKLWKSNGEALAEIEVFESVKDYKLHPTILDSALQTLIGTIDPNEVEQALVLPHHVERLIFHASPPKHVFCYAKCRKQSKGKIVGDLALCDEEGTLFVEVKGVECRLLAHHGMQKEDDLLYFPAWEEKPLGDQIFPLTEEHPWLIGFCDPSNSRHLSELLGKRKSECCLYTHESLHSSEQIEYLLKRYREEENLHIVLGYERTDSKKEKSEIEIVQRCVNLAKAIEKERGDKATTLWVITQGTQSVDGIDHPMNCDGAALWGLCRVIRHEYPFLKCKLIDLDPVGGLGLDSFVLEAIHETKEEDIAWRQERRYAYKLKKADPSWQTKEKKELSSEHDAFVLDLKTTGLIDSLYYRQIKKREPADHEVCIQVHASSLNFKDLMKVLGMLGQNALENTYFGESFGMECAGTIVSKGSKVKNYQVGDKVCAFLPNTFQSYVTLPALYIFPVPAHVALDEAAIYVPFITVMRALKDIAKLKKGERVLIHSATGAVGLAAIQYARYVGAKVIATAGSEEKRAYLHTLGVERCADSRSVSFAEEVLDWTNGKGVDVLLNSLAGEALAKSWSLLAPYGRFIEIGKRDISLNSSLSMRYFDRNTLFAAIDLDKTFVDRPKLIQRLLKETNAFFEKEIFTSLPCTLFPACKAAEAFEFMARGKHMGKIMLKFQGQTVSGTPLEHQSLIAKADSTYLITGGLSGFGLITAKWLAEKGAGHLVLLGRSGAATAEAKEALQDLKNKGVAIKVASVDVSDRDQLAGLLEECAAEMPPLRGIIHSAMVLDDGLIGQLTTDSIRRVLLPKVAGCQNLHQLTQEYPLDFFVLFSSVASIIGNPGQGNYAAANAFLDSFCHYRRSLGLPALTINWGALDTGVLTRNSRVAQHLGNCGIKSMGVKTALKILEKAMQGKNTQLCGMDMGWQKLMQHISLMADSFTFSDFKIESRMGQAHSFLEELRSLDEGKRMEKIIGMIKENVGKTLKMDLDKLDITVRLNTLGVDSLMAMELQTILEMSLGIKIPTMELMKGPTIQQLGHLSMKLMKLDKS